MKEAEFFLQKMKETYPQKEGFKYYTDAFIVFAQTVTWIMKNEFNKVEGLKTSIVSEGIACYFPRLISQNYTIYDCLWMMPKKDVDWCLQNHDRVIDVLDKYMNDDGSDVYKMFYIGGEHAEPPKGFPQKTAYYLGYRVIESCIRERSIKQICGSTAGTTIEMSGLFSGV